MNINAQTGDNATDKNTDGNNEVTTGDSSVTANVVNIVNNNISGGNWWLVIVNEAGKWVGKIVGAPNSEGNVAASSGTELTVDQNGNVTASNNGNGADSTNNTSTNTTTNNETTQNNTAHITNNVNLSANTGGNTASKNTGGDSSITTGDAQVIANLVNFVNNNISGGGKLLVTVVNVFGSWLGDFIAPGATSPTPAPASAQSTPAPTQNSVASTQNTNTSSGSSSVVNTPAPVKTVHPIALASLIHSNKQKTLADSKNTNGVNPQVLGASTTAADSNNAININLAWLLPIGIVGGLFAVLKRRFAR